MKKYLIKSFYLLLSVFLLSFFLVQIFSVKINSILYNYLNLEVERITSNVVDGSVNELLSKELDSDLFILNKNSKNEVEIIDYNTKKVNILLDKISNNIQKKLILLEDGKLNNFMVSDIFKGSKFHYIKNGVVCEIPMGSLSGNGFLANVGPIIPIKMSFLGQVNCNLKTKVTNYGINNLYVEIYLHVEIKERISMPKMSKDSVISIDAPLTIKIIQGAVPDYYGGIINKDSKVFSLPKGK